MTYAEKLRDPRWRCVRERVVERDGHMCRDCGCESELQVHHTFYSTPDPWDTPDEFLITLCTSCHANRQSLENEVKQQLALLAAKLDVWQWWEITRIIRDSHADMFLRGVTPRIFAGDGVEAELA